MAKSSVVTVGLDVHKATIAACWLVGAKSEEVENEIPNDPKAVHRLFQRLVGLGKVRACYEAGPCGYGLQRQLAKLGVECEVIAPSLIPRRPGDRIKTDRRDARKLARLYRAGELTTIRVPNREEEAARDLLRCREVLVQDTTRRKHRIQKFLLRHGRAWTRGANWTRAYWAWLRQQEFELENSKRTLDEYVYQLEHNQERLRSLEAHIEQLAQQEPWKQSVARLRCMRGISTMTAMTLMTEIQDFRRFDNPRELMAYVGVIPSVHKSGGGGFMGSITKTGNAHVRRVLVEAAWHYRHEPRMGPSLKSRTVGQPEWAIELGKKAQRRLHQRFRHLSRQSKKTQVAVVAIARELLGFIWAMLVAPQS